MKRTPVKGSQVMKDFFEIFDRCERTYEDFAHEVGIGMTTMYDWRKGRRGATLDNMIAALDVMGYELKIVRKKPEVALPSGDYFSRDISTRHPLVVTTNPFAKNFRAAQSKIIEQKRRAGK